MGRLDSVSYGCTIIKEISIMNYHHFVIYLFHKFSPNIQPKSTLLKLKGCMYDFHKILYKLRADI